MNEAVLRVGVVLC